jgi:O-antigen/teichoic acid export membrane protein
MSSTLSVFRHALIFGMAPVLQKLISLLLLPYFTHYLDEDEYGLRDLLVAVTGLFTVLFTFEYRTGFIRGYIAAKTAEARKELMTATVTLMTLLAALASVGFFLGWEPVFRFAGVPSVSLFFRIVLTCGIFLDIMIMTLTAAAQAELWSARIVGLNLVQFTVGVVLNIYFVVTLEMGALGLFLGYTLSSIISLVGLLWITRELFGSRLRLGPAFAICWPALVYSLPLWGGSLAYFVVRYAERIIIPAAGSLAGLGIYGIAWKLSNMLVAFLLEPFMRSFDVWRFKIHEERGDLTIIGDTFRWVMLGVGAASLVLSTVGVDLFMWLADERYGAAAVYVPWLNAAVLFQCAYSITASSFFVTAKTGLWMRIFVGAAVLQVAACWLLIPWLGPIGAPLAMIATNLFLYFCSILYGGKLWAVPYRHGLAMGVTVLVTALSLARQQLNAESWFFAGAVDLALLLVFGGSALAFRWVEVAELRLLWERSWSAIRRKVSRVRPEDPGSDRRRDL